MELLRYALQMTAFAVLVGGPVLIFGLWWLRTGRQPSFAWFTGTSVAGCTLAYWVLFLLSEHVLELRFHEIVPGGAWEPADEAAWSESERRAVEAYFADGARNVFALFAPIPLLLYSVALWAVARLALRMAARRAV